MLKQKITVLAQAMVGGPGGIKIKPGKVYELEDSPYVRILVKSGTVTLIDPPTLDPEFLEKAGYELRDGYSYPVKPAIEKLVIKEPEKLAENSSEVFLINFPKKKLKVSKEELQEKDSDKKEDSKEDGVPEITGV